VGERAPERAQGEHVIDDDGSAKQHMMTNEHFIDVCDRVHKKMQKKVSKLKIKYDDDHSDKNMKLFIDAAEELFVFDRVITLCGDLGKEVMRLKTGGEIVRKTAKKKEDVN
jgi:hypothetical protein